jgi:hypothetical protein
MFHTAVTVRHTVDRILRLGCESSRGSEGTRSIRPRSEPVAVMLSRTRQSPRPKPVPRLVRSGPSVLVVGWTTRTSVLVRSPRPSIYKIRIHSSVASKPLSYPCLSSQVFVLSLLVVASLCPILACRRKSLSYPCLSTFASVLVRSP